MLPAVLRLAALLFGACVAKVPPESPPHTAHHAIGETTPTPAASRSSRAEAAVVAAERSRSADELRIAAKDSFFTETIACVAAALLVMKTVHANVQETFKSMPGQSCIGLLFFMAVFCWSICTTYLASCAELVDVLGSWTALSGLFATCFLVVTPLILFVPDQSQAAEFVAETAGAETQQKIRACLQKMKPLLLWTYLFLMVVQVVSAYSIFQIATLKEKIIQQNVQKVGGAGKEGATGPYTITFLYLILTWCSLGLVYERIFGQSFQEDFPVAVFREAFFCNSCASVADGVERGIKVAQKQTTNMITRLRHVKIAASFLANIRSQLLEDAEWNVKSCVTGHVLASIEHSNREIMELIRDLRKLDPTDPEPVVYIREMLLSRCKAIQDAFVMDMQDPEHPMRKFQNELSAAIESAAYIVNEEVGEMEVRQLIERFDLNKQLILPCVRSLVTPRKIADVLAAVPDPKVGGGWALVVQGLTLQYPEELWVVNQQLCKQGWSLPEEVGDFLPQAIAQVSSNIKAGVEAIDTKFNRHAEPILEVLEPLVFFCKNVKDSIADFENLSQSLQDICNNLGRQSESMLSFVKPLLHGLQPRFFFMHYLLYILYAFHALGLVAVLTLRMAQAHGRDLGQMAYAAVVCMAILALFAALFAFFAMCGALSEVTIAPPAFRVDCADPAAAHCETQIPLLRPGADPTGSDEPHRQAFFENIISLLKEEQELQCSGTLESSDVVRAMLTPKGTLTACTEDRTAAAAADNQQDEIKRFQRLAIGVVFCAIVVEVLVLYVPLFKENLELLI